MKRLLAIFTILISTTVVLLIGCQKEDSTKTVSQPGDENSTEGSILIGDRTFEGLNGFTDNYLASSGLKSLPLTCPAITVSPLTSFPLTVTVDWGTAGCTSADDNIARKGQITISLSKLMNEVNAVATFTFKDFVSDGYRISGVHRITYLGLNAGNNWPRYSVFTEARITFPDNKYITYRAEYIRLKSEGASTVTQDDDVWRIEGHSSGVTKEGVAWTASYPSALVKKNSCKWFSSGSVKVSSDGMPDRIINFGDGSCDNKATLTIGDKVTEITL